MWLALCDSFSLYSARISRAPSDGETRRTLVAFYLMFRVPLQFPRRRPVDTSCFSIRYCISFNTRELIRRRHASEVACRVVYPSFGEPESKSRNSFWRLLFSNVPCTSAWHREEFLRSYLRPNKTYRRTPITSYVLLKSVLIQRENVFPRELWPLIFTS